MDVRASAFVRNASNADPSRPLRGAAPGADGTEMTPRFPSTASTVSFTLKEKSWRVVGHSKAGALGAVVPPSRDGWGRQGTKQAEAETYRCCCTLAASTASGVTNDAAWKRSEMPGPNAGSCSVTQAPCTCQTSELWIVRKAANQSVKFSPSCKATDAHGPPHANLFGEASSAHRAAL